MKSISKLLLRGYLRARPLDMRMQQYSYLMARFTWLQEPLTELKEELFPPKPKAPVEEEEVVTAPDEVVLQIINADIRGQLGTYHIEHWLQERGMGHLFKATKTGANQPVVVKEYLLPSRLFNPEEAKQRQQAFSTLAGLSLADGRLSDFRLIAPREAIPDSHSLERCYLVTDAQDASPTLRQVLKVQGVFPAASVRVLLGQVLQTLESLHQQRFVLPAGQVQSGLVHGHINLDTLLWVERQGQFFTYVCDLDLWERLFDPPTVESAPRTVPQDLAGLGRVGFALLIGDVKGERDPQDETAWPGDDPDLEYFIRQLLALAPPFETAAAARQALLQLPPILTPAVRQQPDVDGEQGARSLSKLMMALALLGCLALLGVLIWALWFRQRSPAVIPEPQQCCLKEVSAVPTGQYVYTALEGGTWSNIVSQATGEQNRLPTLTEQLAIAQPEFQLVYRPTGSYDQAIAAVEARQAAFAVLPLPDTELPSDLTSQIIAYDGLAMIVPFGYSERSQSLPRTLRGEISTDQIQKLYQGQVLNWRDLGGADLPVQLYAPANREALDIFKQRLFDTQPGEMIQSEAPINILPPLEMLRTLIRGFETEQVGSIGFAPISQILGQCSVYPLAIKDGKQAAVQPLELVTGDPISPQTDLCDRKGSYFPNDDAIISGKYPLAYPIAIVYPQDNSLPPVGEKFAEMLKTVEGQRLLRETGLVPVTPEPATAEGE